MGKYAWKTIKMSGAYNLDRFFHDLIPSTIHSFLCFSDVGPLLLEIKSPFHVWPCQCFWPPVFKLCWPHTLRWKSVSPQLRLHAVLVRWSPREMYITYGIRFAFEMSRMQKLECAANYFLWRVKLLRAIIEIKHILWYCDIRDWAMITKRSALFIN